MLRMAYVKLVTLAETRTEVWEGISDPLPIDDKGCNGSCRRDRYRSRRRVPMLSRAVVFAAFAACSVISTAAAAQTIGIGPRFSMVRGDLLTNTPPSRFIGGTLRMVTGKHSVLEASMDYRSYL